MATEKVLTDAKLVETKVKVKPALSRKTTDDPQQLIYIGPSINKNGMALRTNQTFIGGHPEYFKELYTMYPLIKQLFVPVAEMRKSIQQINTTGTALNIAVQSLKGV
ncbi:hypothetical protein J41TS12_39320 [Paenibacillus antibioticophila]|uniref:Uncharacterized protein n=1 Tax=Paenibacillus antibioticophila TaxID=1274374 RepID=A0A920CG88_9BACL|nr:hypothetical protein [Paenibacillus antibioticophila]GIO39071.1 hypothetical protein J41TS12_39320 [Paenibacillus antibioticophila]